LLRFGLPLLGSNQDSPDLESSRPGRPFGQLVGNRPLPEHRCPLPCRSLPAHARRNYGKTTAVEPRGLEGLGAPAQGVEDQFPPEPFNLPSNVWGICDKAGDLLSRPCNQFSKKAAAGLDGRGKGCTLEPKRSGSRRTRWRRHGGWCCRRSARRRARHAPGSRPAL
jgi:hypothetical protein